VFRGKAEVTSMPRYITVTFNTSVLFGYWYTAHH